MEIKTNYQLGDVVNLITDSNKEKRIITSIIFRNTMDKPLFGLSVSDKGETFHYEYEIEKLNNNKKGIVGFVRRNKK